MPLDSEIAIQERTLTRYGLNLYDGATWEIALALEGVLRVFIYIILNHHDCILIIFHHSGLADVALIYESNILYPASTGGNANIGGIIDIRSDTEE